MTHSKQIQPACEQPAVGFGKGFDASNLRNMRSFYLCFPKREALSLELSWSHQRTEFGRSCPNTCSAGQSSVSIRHSDKRLSDKPSRSRLSNNTPAMPLIEAQIGGFFCVRSLAL